MVSSKFSSQRALAGREETYQWRQSNWLLEKLEGTADSRACVVHQRHGATTHVPGRPTGPLSGAVSRLACCGPLCARRSQVVATVDVNNIFIARFSRRKPPYDGMPPRTGMADDSHEFQLVLERLRLNDPEMTNVRIAAWSPEFAGRLSAALRVNSHLRTLEVDGAAVSAGQKMGAEGGVMLAKAIESHPQLQRLHVNFHNLGDVGVGALAGALQWNQHVRDVAVNSNKMGRAGAESLAALLRENNTLTALSLGGNSEASPAGVIALAEALMHNTSLRELNLSFIPLNANGVSQALAELLGAASCRLSNLRAVDCRLDAESIVPFAQALHSCSSLTSLDLSENNRLRDDGCTQLAHALISNSCLTNLLLNWSGIGL